MQNQYCLLKFCPYLQVPFLLMLIGASPGVCLCKNVSVCVHVCMYTCVCLCALNVHVYACGCVHAHAYLYASVYSTPWLLR